MAEYKRQHYVPRFYLKLFASDELGRVIKVYNIKQDSLIENASLKNQCSANNFYGSSTALEHALSVVESGASRIFMKMIRYKYLPLQDSEEMLTVLSFVLLQGARTQQSSDENEKWLVTVLKTAMEDDPRIGSQLDKFDISVKQAHLLPMQIAYESVPIILDLRMALLINDSDIPFLTSDNPLLIMNPFASYKNLHGSQRGYASKGIILGMPLSPKHYLLLYDPERYKCGSGKDGNVIRLSNNSDITSLNGNLYVYARENLYIPNNISLDNIRLMCSRYQKWRVLSSPIVDKYRSIDDSTYERTLITSSKGKRVDDTPGFIHLQKSAKAEELDEKFVHARNEKLVNYSRELGKMAGYHNYTWDRLIKYVLDRDRISKIFHNEFGSEIDKQKIITYKKIS